MTSTGQMRHVAGPDYGFAGCNGDIQTNPLSLTDAFEVMAVSVPDGGCETAPFPDRFGLFVEEAGGWLPVFSGPYLAAFVHMDLGGRGSQATLLPLGDAPRYQVTVEDTRLILRDGGDARVIYTKAP